MQHLNECTARKCRSSELEAELAELEKGLKVPATGAAEKKAMGGRKKQVEEEMRALKKADVDDKSVLLERHIVECRSVGGRYSAMNERVVGVNLHGCPKWQSSPLIQSTHTHPPPLPLLPHHSLPFVVRKLFGGAMKDHVHADKRWDAYIIVAIMRGFLPTLFMDIFPDEFHAKDFLCGILRIVKARNDRSHHSNFVESDVVDAMNQMFRVLQATKHEAAIQMDGLLKRAKQMLRECPEEGTSLTTTMLSKEEYT